MLRKRKHIFVILEFNSESFVAAVVCSRTVAARTAEQPEKDFKSWYTHVARRQMRKMPKFRSWRVGSERIQIINSCFP